MVQSPSSLHVPFAHLKQLSFACLIIACILLNVRTSWASYQQPVFTAEEIQYLQDHGPIVFVSQSQYPPFEAVQKGGGMDGMCIELIRWLTTELGIKAEFRHMTFQEAQQAVLNGSADVLTSLFYSDKRAERFAFSEPLFDVPASIFVKADRPDISRLEDLRGKRIAIQLGDYAKDFLEAREIFFELVPTENFAQATDAVIAGRADALIGDEQIVLHHLYSNKLTHLAKKVGAPLYVGKNCLAMNKGNAPLIGIITKGIAYAKERKMLDAISTKWLGAPFPAGEQGLGRFAPHLASGIASLALAVLIIGSINRKLRSIVRERTREQAAILDASLVGIANVRNRTVIWANSTMHSIFGYQPPEMEQLPTLNLYPSQAEYERLGAEAFPAFAKGLPYKAELEMRRKDGSRILVQLQGKALDLADPTTGSVWTFQNVTAQRQLDEELRESEEKYRFLIESANDAVMIHTILEDGRPGPFFLVNELACEWFGYSREDFMHLSPLELNDPQHLDHIQQVMEQLQNEGRAVFETVMLRKDGSRVPVEISTRLLRVKNFHYILSLVRDTTERKRIERELRDSLTFNSSLIETMIDGIAVCNDICEFPFVKFTVWNPAMEKLTGYSIDEINRLGWYQTIYRDPKVQEQAKQRMERMRQGDNLNHEEWVITHKDGELRTVGRLSP